MEPKKMRYQKLGQSVVTALKRRRFEAFYCDSGDQARQKALELIDRDATVGWGGSATISQLCLIPALRLRGQTLIDRDTEKDVAGKNQKMREALCADIFLMSANAIAEDGMLVNLDGIGNRVAALVFGPKKVLVIAGMNKVTKTVEDAVSRVRNYAAPMNAQRFGGKTPCTATGICADCLSEDCICASLVVTRLCKPAERVTVILIGEDLGM